jgi:hypothetical protein
LPPSPSPPTVTHSALLHIDHASLAIPLLNIIIIIIIFIIIIIIIITMTTIIITVIVITITIITLTTVFTKIITITLSIFSQVENKILQPVHNKVIKRNRFTILFYIRSHDTHEFIFSFRVIIHAITSLLFPGDPGFPGSMA